MKKFLLCLLLLFTVSVYAQETVIFLPIIVKDSYMAATPKLIITDGTTEVDLLGPNSGWKLADPYWNPQIAQYKGGGSFVNAQLAEGRRLVHKEYDNVVETIPLSLSGLDQNKAMQTAHELLELMRQAGDYWAEPYEYDPVWIEVKLACNDCLTGYSRIITGTIPEITNPFGQPFFSSYDKPVMENITLTFEREPFWRATKPGEIIGPLYNLIDNPDFELWTQPPGVIDNQPDSWNDIETTHIAGTNNRDQTLPKFGNSNVRIRVSGSTLAGAAKGIQQVINDTNNNTEYTIVAWVRNEGVSNGVGRILITYSSQLELYRESASHGWTLYTGTITTGNSDVVGINCEILTTAANTDGTIHIDGLMFLEGDWEQEAKDGVLPYLTGSHIKNHWDQETGNIVNAGDINFIDVHSIPGNVDSLIRLEVTNDSDPSDTEDVDELIKELRIGQKRSRDVFKFQNVNDPIGDADTTASGGNRLTISNVAQEWIRINTFSLSSVDVTQNNSGRFRLLARVRDKAASGDPTLQIRAKYTIGTSGQNQKILDTVTVPVRDEWTVVDLTPTKMVIWNTKFLGNDPGDLSYTLEFKRSTGTADAHFDYSLLIPTDGGLVFADIDPSLTISNMLVIDNTASGSIRGTNKGNVSKTVWEGTGLSDQFLAAKTFNNSLYISDVDNNLILVWDGNTMTSHSIPGDVANMDVYNGELYAGILGGTTGLYRFTSPSSWTLVALGGTAVFDLQVFNGFLYITDISNNVYRWDGSTSVQVLSLGLIGFPTLGTYNNRLYLNAHNAAGVDELYAFNGTTWTNLGDQGLGVGTRLVSHDGFLWANFGSDIRRYDGVSFISDPNWGAFGTSFLSVYNNKLYVYGASASSRVALYRREDDGTYTKVFEISDPNQDGGHMDVLDGSLYLVANGNANITSKLIQFNDNASWYTVPDYQGSLFTAPPKIRHRWVFSWNRDNFINNIDDKALIGIGFVPRYLTLRGKN